MLYKGEILASDNDVDIISAKERLWRNGLNMHRFILIV